MPSSSLLGTFLGWLRGPQPQALPKPQPAQPPLAHTSPALRPAPAQPHRSPYARIDRLLTIAEGDFCAALRQAPPSGLTLFAQVRLANLVRVQPWAQRDKTHWYRIQAKCVDFVLCDERTFAPRLVVELDDASHDRKDRQTRDAFVDEVLTGVGLPILHVRWQRHYDVAVLERQILAMLGEHHFEKVAATCLPAPHSVAVTKQPAIDTSVVQHQVCGQCAAELRPGAKFCSQCGATFSHAR